MTEKIHKWKKKKGNKENRMEKKQDKNQLKITETKFKKGKEKRRKEKVKEI